MNVTIPDVMEMLGIAPPNSFPGHIHCIHHSDSDPSLWVTEDRGWWAFCCNTGGDAIDLVRFTTGASFYQAKRFIEGAMDEEWVRPERKEREVLDLTGRLDDERALEEEGFIDSAVEFVTERWPHLDFHWLARNFDVVPTRHALWIPHADDDGVVRGIKTRGYATGKKLAVEGSCFTSRLYQERLSTIHVRAVLCEGESDTWSMAKLYEGHPVTVYGLPSGAKTWKPKFLEELRRHRHVTLWLDPDTTGRQAAAHLFEVLMAAGIPTVDRVVPMDYEDVAAAAADGWVPGAS